MKKNGNKLKILSCGIIQRRAIKNCPIIWPNEAIIPKLISEKYFFGNFWNRNKKARLITAPKRLRKKVGDKKDPTRMLDIKTLNNDTQAAVFKSNLTRVYKMIILAIPGFIPGIGLGRKNSIIDKTIAIAESFAMIWSYPIILVIDWVKGLISIGNWNWNLIW